MLGKAMRIATMCTLAFAICGERLKAKEKEEEKTSHPLRRWLAKSLLLGASVHAASGFGQPAHSASSASRVGRRAGLRELEPLKAWGRDTINDPWEEILLEEGGARAWEEWRSNAENYLLKDQMLLVPKLLVKMYDEKGQKLLVKMHDETSFHESEAERKASEADVRRFQNWQEEIRESYHNTYHTLRTPAEIHALVTLKDAMNDSFSNLLQAQRAVKATKISDVLDAAERGERFNVDGIPWEEYIIDHSRAPSKSFNIQGHLQRMKGKHLQNLWLSTRWGSAKRDAEKEKRDAEKLLLSTKSESAKRDDLFISDWILAQEKRDDLFISDWILALDTNYP